MQPSCQLPSNCLSACSTSRWLHTALTAGFHHYVTQRNASLPHGNRFAALLFMRLRAYRQKPHISISLWRLSVRDRPGHGEPAAYFPVSQGPRASMTNSQSYYYYGQGRFFHHCHGFHVILSMSLYPVFVFSPSALFYCFYYCMSVCRVLRVRFYNT